MNFSRSAFGVVLAAAAWTMGCTPDHFRTVDPNGAKWRDEVATYPRVVVQGGEPSAPVPGERVEVYYREAWGSDRWRFSERGDEKAPEGRVVVVADLAVFRGPLPDHEGALMELQRMAGKLGARMLTETHCTAVVATSYVGGKELVGWIYEARAARMKEGFP